MTLEACQGRLNICYGKAFGPLELSIRQKKGEQASVPRVMGYPDLEDRLLSGYLDSMTRSLVEETDLVMFDSDIPPVKMHIEDLIKDGLQMLFHRYPEAVDMNFTSGCSKFEPYFFPLDDTNNSAGCCVPPGRLASTPISNLQSFCLSCSFSYLIQARNLRLEVVTH